MAMDLPSEEQLDEFFSTEDSEELQTDETETPETEEETVTLSQEEYDELKKGQMLQADYTRKRQEESQRVKDLEEINEGHRMLNAELRKEIFTWKKSASELEKAKNLLQGYKKVIQDLSTKLSRKDS